MCKVSHHASRTRTNTEVNPASCTITSSSSSTTTTTTTTYDDDDDDGDGSYIESIRPTAESFGIAKIVPPVGWDPPPTPLRPHARKLVPTKKQALHSLMNVRSYN